MGHLQLLDYLLRVAHADAMHSDTDGWTALHNASAKGYALVPHKSVGLRMFLDILKSRASWFK
jgi:hypothetical protein